MSFTASDILRTMDKVDARTGGVAPLSVTRKTNHAAGTPSASTGFAQILKHRTALAGAQSKDAAATLEGAKEHETRRREQAEKAAGDLVSNALIMPMLKQLRRSVWGENTVFSRGIAEKTFGPQFDMQISDRIAHSPRLGLKTALTERLLKRGQPDANPGTNIQQQQPAADAASSRSIDLHG
jgi:Rod binding domain-containing protein